MINRQLGQIMTIPIQKFTAFDVDPHGQFIAIYLKPSNSVHIIRTFHFSYSSLKYVIPFMQEQRYDQTFNLKSDAQIPSRFLFQNHAVQKIVISNIYQSEQLILVSNYFRIKVFSIQFIGDSSHEIYLKYQGEVGSNVPAKYFSCHDGQIWTSHIRGIMEVNHKVGSRWELKNTLEPKREAVRLIAYKQQNGHLYEMQNRNKFNKKPLKKHPKNKAAQRKNKAAPCNNPPLSKLSYFIQSQNKCKLIRSTYNRSLPHKKPSIIYITKDDVLSHACRHHLYPEFRTKVLCTNNKKPVKFNNCYEEYVFEKRQNDLPIHYFACPSGSYVVCSEQEGYSIMSKHFGWRKVLYETMQPTINPFFQEFQVSFLTQLQIYMGEHAKYASRVLFEKFEFALILFSREQDRLYQFQEFDEESFVRLELVALRKNIWLDSSENQTDHQQNDTTRPPIQVQAQRFKLLDLRMATDDPLFIRWISPTQIIYFASKKQEENYRLFYAKFHQQTLLQLIDNAFLKILAQEFQINKGQKLFAQ